MHKISLSCSVTYKFLFASSSLFLEQYIAEVQVIPGLCICSLGYIFSALLFLHLGTFLHVICTFFSNNIIQKLVVGKTN